MSDENIRALILARWKKIDGGVEAHCGKIGLAVGCPVCRKVYK